MAGPSRSNKRCRLMTQPACVPMRDVRTASLRRQCVGKKLDQRVRSVAIVNRKGQLKHWGDAKEPFELTETCQLDRARWLQEVLHIMAAGPRWSSVEARQQLSPAQHKEIEAAR